MTSVFLSHNHKDKPFVRRLGARLQSHGIRVWVDEAEMQVGDSLISKIETAIREFQYLGIVLSSDSVSSEWVRREVNIALNEEIQGRRVKVLPLLYRKCDIPGFLTDKVYADFSEDFEAGFDTLLRRLSHDLQEESHRQRRAYEVFLTTYQDWVTFGRREADLLNGDNINLVLQHVAQPRLAVDVMEYLLCSISLAPAGDRLDINNLRVWFDELQPAEITDLFDRLLGHQNLRVRKGVITLAERLKNSHATATVLSKIDRESHLEVKRAGIGSLFRILGSLPDDLALRLIDTDEDWLIQSYALRSLQRYRSCLLVSDGTEFAMELGTMALNAGYRLVILQDRFDLRELQDIDQEVLGAHELVILVRGEHYGEIGLEQAYSRLREYVRVGGSLFATSWVSWENVYHREFSFLLPFAHIMQEFREDRLITCGPASNELAARLFPGFFSFHTSLETLSMKESSIALLETHPGKMPIFGYRRFGSGVCYYLNSCQHSCLSRAVSPFQACEELQECFERVFEWIFRERSHILGNQAQDAKKLGV